MTLSTNSAWVGPQSRAPERRRRKQITAIDCVRCGSKIVRPYDVTLPGDEDLLLEDPAVLAVARLKCRGCRMRVEVRIERYSVSLVWDLRQ